jgi:hypothetical protein
MDGMALWAPWAGVLVAGDYLSPVEIPMVSAGGSLSGYRATLERLRPLVERERLPLPEPPLVERLPVLVRLRLEPTRPRAERVPLEERPRLADDPLRALPPRLELLPFVSALSSALSPSDSSSESSSPRSFFATPTAAGIATPIAAPAATFFGVDIPSSSDSSDSVVTSSSSATTTSVVED